MATLTTAARNAACDAIVDLVDAGSGAGQIILQTGGAAEVATLAMSDPAFGAASTGVATASSITDDSSATGGTMAQFVMEDSDGNDVITGSVGTSGADINFNTVTVGAGSTVSITSLTVTVPAS